MIKVPASDPSYRVSAQPEITINTSDIADCIIETCPWSGEPVQADSLTDYSEYVVGYCNPGCRDKFEAAILHFD